MVLADVTFIQRLLLVCGFGIVPFPANAAPALPVIPDRVFRITAYGSVGDGQTVNTVAIGKALDALNQSGGGTLEVSTGRFLTDPFVLGSSTRLQLDKGAVILIRNDIATYPKVDYKGRKIYASGISAMHAHDIEICGEGTIDGQGAPWWELADKHPDAQRPLLIKFGLCERIRVTGVTLCNSPMFHLVPSRCTDVTITGVTITAPHKAHNTDGMDPSGSNYFIDHCTMDVGDDDIAIKPSGTEANKNFLISNCTFLRGHGMSVGSGTNGGLDNLTVRDCTFNGTGAGIRIKTVRGRGGLVQNCTYDHLTMTKVNLPIDIIDYYPEHAPSLPNAPADDPAQPVTPLTPTFANITISNVTCTDSPSAGRIWGVPEMPISGITFRNVHFAAATGLKVYNAKDITFIGSEIKVESGEKLILYNAKVSGLN